MTTHAITPPASTLGTPVPTLGTLLLLQASLRV